MDGRDGDEPRHSKGVEPWAWAACLLAPIMPARILIGLAGAVDGRLWPFFPLALYIGLFTLMVVIIRPRSLR